MKIGVIGSSGFIGSSFVNEALCAGDTIFGWDLFPPNNVINNDKFIFNTWENGHFNHESLFGDCDCLLVLAAKRITPDFSFEDYIANIDIITKVLSTCLKYNIRNIVTLSSTSVYSNQNIPWKESETNTSLNLYGASKAAIDELIKYFNHQYDFTIKSLRLAQVIGLGERKGYLLNTFIDNAINKETISIFGTGEGKRQYIYIKDVISAIYAAFRSTEGGIYNIGIPESISTKNLADVINNVFGNVGNVKYEPDKEEDLQERWMDTSLAKKVLKWEATYTVELALEDIKQTIYEEG